MPLLNQEERGRSAEPDIPGGTGTYCDTADELCEVISELGGESGAA